jgi:hypothetical protein
MRPPRIRITTGTLLFVVLIVAVNCGVARHYYPTLKDNPNCYIWWNDPLQLMVGLFPLLNVAIVGMLLLLARALNSFRRERAMGTRLTPPGFTYFSVHLVALGCFTALVMPGVFEKYREYLQPSLNFMENIWSHFLTEKTNHDSWLFLMYVMLGVFLSGPLLLISWIGGMVARRYAVSLPRRRIVGLTVLVSLGFAATALAVAMTPQPFREYHDEVNLDFQIVDKESGEPIGASFLLVTRAFRPDLQPASSALTGPDGRARLALELLTVGERNSFRTMGTIETWGQWLEISAPGFQTRRTSLSEVLGSSMDLEHPRLGRVALARGKATEDSFRDIAGKYGNFRIERDGRFTYHRSGVCLNVRSREEFGYVSRMGDEFVLHPIPEPGREADSSMRKTYRLIQWSEHLYFCSTDDLTLQRVCRAGLPNLRDSDREKPLTGWPRLPLKVWVKFAIDELTLRSEENSLKMALQSLFERRYPGPELP